MSLFGPDPIGGTWVGERTGGEYNRGMKKPRRGRVHPKRAFVSICVAALLPAALFLLSPLPGCGNGEPPPLPEEESAPGVIPISGLSPDQSRKVAELGYPDHFFISIDPLGTVRMERWIYFAPGKAFDFDAGRLLGEEAVEDQSADYPPTDLHPQDFSALMTPEEASRLLGEPLYTHEVRDSLMPENTIVVYPKAVLLFREGQLIGVDTQVKPPQIPMP